MRDFGNSEGGGGEGEKGEKEPHLSETRVLRFRKGAQVEQVSLTPTFIVDGVAARLERGFPGGLATLALFGWYLHAYTSFDRFLFLPFCLRRVWIFEG